MLIKPTHIPGAYIVSREPFDDERGSFARVFCKKEFEAAGLCNEITQVSLCTNHKKGTLRGLHLQKGSSAEDKLVTCVNGMVFDVCVDVRDGSPTYGQWIGETLSSEKCEALFIPKGCAHGYLSMSDNCQLMYFVTEYYNPDSADGYMYDDPVFSINWPMNGPYILSDHDLAWDYIKK